MTEAGGLPAGVAIPLAIADAVTATLVAWAGSAPLLSVGEPDEDAWQDARLEYSFDVAAAGPTGETVLRAEGYDGNRLDWCDLDVTPGETLDAVASDATTETIVRTLLPAPATFAGMPSARWWEMEDSRISFGRITAERPDLARMLLVEFASVYGNDHFVVPIDVPVGSLVRVDSVVVTDTFGERFLIEPASAPARWGLYRPSRPDGGSEAVLVVLPTVVDTLHSRPIEETVLLRDEMANLVWGVESTVASAAGRPVDRLSEAARAATAVAPPAGSARARLPAPVGRAGALDPLRPRRARARRHAPAPEPAAAVRTRRAGSRAASGAGARPGRARDPGGGGAPRGRARHPGVAVEPMGRRLHPRVARPGAPHRTRPRVEWARARRGGRATDPEQLSRTRRRGIPPRALRALGRTRHTSALP